MRAPASPRSQPRLVERDGLLELKRTRRGGSPRACLLDQWDPLLVGWRSRDSLLDRYPRRDSPEAHFRPFAYVGARAVATWSLRKRRRLDRRAVRASDARRQRRARGRRRGRRALPLSVKGAAGRTPTCRATPFRRASASANVGVMFDRDTCLARREPNLSLRTSGSRRCLGRDARRAPLRARRPSRRDLAAGAGALLQLLPPAPPR